MFGGELYRENGFSPRRRGLRGDLSAGLGTAAAGGGALPAMIHGMTPAFLCACRANFGTQLAETRGEIRIAGEFPRGQGADVGAASVEVDATGHHLDLVFLEAEARATFAGGDAGPACVDTGLMFIVGGSRHVSVSHARERTRVIFQAALSIRVAKGSRWRSSDLGARPHHHAREATEAQLDAGLYCAQRKATRGGDLPLAHALEKSALDDVLLGGRQPVDDPLEILAKVGLFRTALHAVEVFGHGRAVAAEHFEFIGDTPIGHALANAIDGTAAHERDEPAERLSSLRDVAFRLLPELEKNILEHFLGVGFIM